VIPAHNEVDFDESGKGNFSLLRQPNWRTMRENEPR
jgi:hypothetical protein